MKYNLLHVKYMQYSIDKPAVIITNDQQHSDFSIIINLTNLKKIKIID